MMTPRHLTRFGVSFTALEESRLPDNPGWQRLLRAHLIMCIPVQFQVAQG